VESVTLERIIDGLYERPTRLAGYDFAAIDADVLGAVYEQYLGYVAQVAQEQAKREAAQARFLGFEEPVFELEAKRLKRKQQGIYYTPKFVVDYIVRETVGRFLEERSHNEIVNAKILDPACGSGSFLIRAYEELLNYHAYQKGKSAAELDQWERLPILTGNIFGVDLDRQAVEIARLNLLLRSLSRQETLPSLADNIRQGNSLISGTEQELRSYFGDNWQDKKPFNWQTEFKDIMANGGFDVVIGNPPYVTEQLIESERRHFKEKFKDSALGKLNTYRLFMHRGIQLLKENGFLSFIVPITFLTSWDAVALRRLVLENCRVLATITIPEKATPFQSVTQATAIVVLQKTSSARARLGTLVTYAKNISGPSGLVTGTLFPRVPQTIFQTLPDSMFVLPDNPETLKITQRLDRVAVKLCTLAEVYQGEVNLTNYASWISGTKVDESFAPLIRGIDVDRYTLDLYPSKRKLWWVKADEVRRPHANNIRIVTQEVSNMQQTRRLKASIAPQGYFCAHTTNYLLPKDPGASLPYILGLLNSKLLDFYFKLFNSTNHLPAREIERLPIPQIDFDNPSDKKRHDDLVTLVDRMLELNRRLAPIRNTACAEREELLRQIKQTDQEIDNLVYDLYGLTEEERKIVEEATKGQK
jgi:Alw26I/Eco31I/Esp3I family type II restriction m6 adenine DNA methyltransferase